MGILCCVCTHDWGSNVLHVRCFIWQLLRHLDVVCLIVWRSLSPGMIWTLDAISGLFV